ncbi:MAG: glutamyl-tRNA reductase [Bryobacteraceae bacterium]|nr:MAG: glutamyl-tRNA reductase [Bryobacteraceae bacterium]
MLNLLLTGLNHRTAPVEVRERLAVNAEQLPAALDALRACPGVDEVMLLSTCNRVEVLAHGGSDRPVDERPLVEALAAMRGLDAAALMPHFYVYRGEDALRHLFRVASSLDSMVLGEPQILGQLKDAYSAAKERGALQSALEPVLARAFAVAKRVRNETAIGRNAVSVSYAAVDLAKQIFGDLRPRHALLIGAGKMAELAARHLRRGGCGRIYVTNRTRARAEQMAALVEGAVIDYESFQTRLHEMDIVLASSGATDYILRKEDIRTVLRKRQNRPVFLIDIAVPRNIDPAVDELENAYLYDIDDLGREVEANRQARQREAEEAEQIIQEEVQRLIERFRTREVAPVIVSLQQRLDELAREEMERWRGKLGVDGERAEALEAYTRSLLNKLAHGPIVEIRRAAALPEGDRILAVIRRMFRLEES